MTQHEGPIRLGLVGVGKIARDQHLPVIAQSADFDLAAVASSHTDLPGVATYPTLKALLAAEPGLDAVALCTPPRGRHALALEALEAGKAVLLEKPPGAGLSEVEDLARVARRAGVALFATWHSRHAPGVEPARAWLADRAVRRVRITWREDVRRWHPGQAWIWEPGGLGVFDPGVNALSIATRILPRPFFLVDAELLVPANRQTPIAARLDFTDDAGARIAADFDWRETGEQAWTVEVETDAGALLLADGGARLTLAGVAQPLAEAHDRHAEYAGVYRRFAGLVRAREVDVDLAPLRHVADACLAGRRSVVEAFVE